MRKNILAMLLIIFSFSYGNEKIALKKNISTPYELKDINNIKICALRVDFQEDDKEITSGNGKFLYKPETDDTLNSKFKIDPIPHNRAYFKDHILSLANFYNHASNGKLIIDIDNSEVYPLNNDQYYTVSQKMDYYNPFLEEDSVDIKLAELFIEAVHLADADVNFADYDVVVIFHAGVGQDFAVDLDPTPYDIPSAYLNPKDIEKAVGNPETFEGISLDNGSTLLDECIILPETQNHTLYEKWDEVFGTDDAFNVQVGLNGTFAFMFGFYLGIPGMYNTETGDAGIGRWGMMDQGSVNLNGLVPALPNAWIREYMGWIDPVEAKTNMKVKLFSAESNSDTLAWKIRIDDDEYYLVENRCNFLRDGWNLDSIRNEIYDGLGKDANFPSVLPLIKDSIGAIISEETGVLLSVPRYDVGLPGSGLLIWHIDETIIETNLESNSVNNDRDRRGISMEEADGAVDIGFPPANMFSDVHNGWGFDAWFAKNEGFWDVNKNFYRSKDSIHIGFTDKTFPNTRSNDNVYTGIAIDSIGQSGEVMEFTIGFDAKNGNFPVTLGNIYTMAMSFCDYDKDGNEDVIVVADQILLYNHNGILQKTVIFNEDNIHILRIKSLVIENQFCMAFQTPDKLFYVEYAGGEIRAKANKKGLFPYGRINLKEGAEKTLNVYDKVNENKVYPQSITVTQPGEITLTVRFPLLVSGIVKVVNQKDKPLPDRNIIIEIQDSETETKPTNKFGKIDLENLEVGKKITVKVKDNLDNKKSATIVKEKNIFKLVIITPIQTTCTIVVIDEETNEEQKNYPVKVRYADEVEKNHSTGEEAIIRLNNLIAGKEIKITDGKNADNNQTHTLSEEKNNYILKIKKPKLTFSRIKVIEQKYFFFFISKKKNLENIEVDFINNKGEKIRRKTDKDGYCSALPDAEFDDGQKVKVLIHIEKTNRKGKKKIKTIKKTFTFNKEQQI